MFQLVIFTFVAVGAAQPDAPLTLLNNGSPVRGEQMVSSGGRGIWAYKNIPYAEPPLGELRFADPVPKAAWSAELAQQKSGPIMCPQMDEYLLNSGFLGQEDCLVLNVFVPAESSAKGPLSVMFFIHGGGFMSGTGNDLLYGPELLLDEDVILVTGNYRLAALGFLSTNTEEFSGNYGLKDQSLILQWIKQNIGQFNGDPNKVTLFGESAGSVAVAYHLMSPMSEGLFHAAILQSGNPFDMWAHRTAEETLGFAEKLFDHFGCKYNANDYKPALDCLREKDFKSITEAVQIYREWDVHPMIIYTPTMELENSKSPFITAKDVADPSNGAQVPVLMGNTANEGAFWVGLWAAKTKTVADLNTRFDELLPVNLFLFNRYTQKELQQKAKKIQDFYFKGENFKWDRNQRDLVDLITANQFLVGTPEVLARRLAAAASADTFLYKFNYKGAASLVDLLSPQGNANLGVCHADDLLYLFPIVQNIIPFRKMSAEDKQMQKLMVTMWTNFARTGNPSTTDLKWTPIKQYPLEYLRIGNCNMTSCEPDRRTESRMEKGYFEEAIRFMQDLHDRPAWGQLATTTAYSAVSQDDCRASNNEF